MSQQHNNEGGGQVQDRSGVATASRIAPPKRYKVVLLNDDRTTMEFVVQILIGLFGKSYPEAQALMLQIDVEGSGVAGIFTEEVAETKLSRLHNEARMAGFPLRGTLEEE